VRIIDQQLSRIKIGDKFGFLTVVGPEFCLSRKGQRSRRVVVACECKRVCCVRTHELLRIGRPTSSCGCHQRAQTRKAARNHGLVGHPIYNSWAGMIQRCEDRNSQNWDNYGGRGISLIDSWRNSFQDFYKWSIENGWAPGLSIERIDNDGNYEPSNCRWATQREQTNNTRRSRKIACFGVTKTASQWTQDPRCLVRKSPTIHARIFDYGWTPERALTTPVRRDERHTRDVYR
jgi:hypothetical protein